MHIAATARPLPVRSLCAVALLLAPALSAQTPTKDAFDIGRPKLKEIWVDAGKGDDDRGGNSRKKALKTIREALHRIPRGVPVKNGGYHILLAPGQYDRAELEHYLGSETAPLIIEAADGPGTVRFSVSYFYTSHYIYLVNVGFERSGKGNVLHIASSDHILLRGVTVHGVDIGDVMPREALKVNQCRYIYIEDSDFSGADDNSIDFVAVQYGHVLRNRIHDCAGWNMYAKGGSAHLRIEDNEFYGSPEGGFTAGQETGFEYMTAPWLQWEASHIRFVNNYLHDIRGHGLGVAGGYDILFAYNTLYRVAAAGYPIRIFGGTRLCGTSVERCRASASAGGWGRGILNVTDFIPSKNVFIYNNLVYNPPGAEIRRPPFSIARLAPNPPGENHIRVPLAVDVNLQIKGNYIWLGAPGGALGIEQPDSGCQAANPACNPGRLRADNSINVAPPDVVLDGDGVPKPRPGGNLMGANVFPPPAFPAAEPDDADVPGAALFDNRVTADRAGAPRQGPAPAGAYLPASPQAAAN